MEKKKKILYIITIILYGLATIGGVMSVVGFIMKNPTIQCVGMAILAVGFLLAIIIEKFILKKE